MTKKELKIEIEKEIKALFDNHMINEANYLYGKNLEGRYYIHSKATKQQLENLYVDIVNFKSDNRISD